MYGVDFFDIFIDILDILAGMNRNKIELNVKECGCVMLMRFSVESAIEFVKNFKLFFVGGRDHNDPFYDLFVLLNYVLYGLVRMAFYHDFKDLQIFFCTD